MVCDEGSCVIKSKLFKSAGPENAETIEEVYEPFLIQEGFLTRTPRGRQLTDLTYKHLGKIRNNPGELF